MNSDKVVFVDAHTHQQSIGPKIQSMRVSSHAKEWLGLIQESKATRHNTKLALADSNKFSIGIHPWYCHSFDSHQDELAQMNVLLQENLSIHIGEIGLDFHRKIPRIEQVKLFEAQLILAQKWNRQVSIHLVKSYNETRKILEKYPKVKGLIHGYSGSINWMNQMEQKGWFFSFGLEILKESRVKSRDAFLSCNQFLLETDDAKLSENEFIQFYQDAAVLKNMDILELKAKTTKSFHQLFSTS